MAPKKNNNEDDTGEEDNAGGMPSDRFDWEDGDVVPLERDEMLDMPDDDISSSGSPTSST